MISADNAPIGPKNWNGDNSAVAEAYSCPYQSLSRLAPLKSFGPDSRSSEQYVVQIEYSLRHDC